MIDIKGTLVSEGAGGVYNERMLGNYRVWDPYRSKLAALWYLDKTTTLDKDEVVLYLGAANGTTVSHVADYVESVYAVEFAPRPMEDLLVVAKKRKNIIPIYADATRPVLYASLLEPADLLYQDVAQPNQAGIAVKHLPFLKSGGRLILMLKTRSVDIRKSPDEVFADTCAELTKGGYIVEKSTWLNPYHQDHAAIICRKE
ncbi:MAG: fibrillarin-like rRNA/tRNA 2'-O-methyltransferase [Methanocorpusculum sp.]|jgi:fibrillarin-like pre-rRNA processing protein|nr:fibrillarin-like rRNA/tRNA 2'-O-methyltransferase [Methanocorpusculum sp.]MDD3256673.1 fibrillarin-like rRNA/tRNA 2'-O-methyltransferase [Methanocorpusculum sp.]